MHNKQRHGTESELLAMHKSQTVKAIGDKRKGDNK